MAFSLCAFCLTACTKDDLDGIGTPGAAQYITFGTPALTVESRAATDGFHDEFPNGGQFGVLGYCLAQNVLESSRHIINFNSGGDLWGSKNQYCRPRVFNNVPVTYTEGIGCTYPEAVRWYYDGAAKGQTGLSDDEAGNNQLSNTANYQYAFFAYYPYKKQGPYFTFERPGSRATEGAPVFTFTMPFEKNIDATDFDTELNSELTPDALFAVNYNHKRTDGQVDFNFSHILSGLSFQVNNYSKTVANDGTDTGQNLYIRSIKLKGEFYRSIRVDLSNATTNVTYNSDDTYKGSYTIYQSSDETNGTSVTWRTENGANTLQPERYLRLLPGVDGTQGFLGPIRNGNFNGYVEIEYKFGDDAKWQKATPTRPTSFAPRSGIRYTAQLNWVGDAFVIMVTPDNDGLWEDGFDGDLEFE